MGPGRIMELECWIVDGGGDGWTIGGGAGMLAAGAWGWDGFWDRAGWVGWLGCWVNMFGGWYP
jgi:hypothetical protein